MFKVEALPKVVILTLSFIYSQIRYELKNGGL